MVSVENDRQAAASDLRFTVVGPDGIAVRVDPYDGDLRYDVPDQPGTPMPRAPGIHKPSGPPSGDRNATHMFW